MDTSPSAIDIINNTSLHSSDNSSHYEPSNEDTFTHPFLEIKDNTYEPDDSTGIHFSQNHRKTIQALQKASPDEWSSLEDLFHNIYVEPDTYSYKLPKSVKTYLKKQFISKPNLKVKPKEVLSSSRKQSSSLSAGSKCKQERKLSLKGKSLRISKPGDEGKEETRKMSVNRNSGRRSITEDKDKGRKNGDAESLSKLENRSTYDQKNGGTGRKPSIVEPKSRNPGTPSKGPSRRYSYSPSSSRKPSADPEVTSIAKLQRRKKSCLQFEEFVISPLNYNMFRANETQQLDQNSLSWSCKERARKKVTSWANKYLS